METIDIILNPELKIVNDYIIHDSSKIYAINSKWGRGLRAILLFENSLDLFRTKIEEKVKNLFYHTFLISHQHLPTQYEVRK